ncbi:HD domain-containing protein [bacterium]|nr:HD domain-containing protein [bacterium]
MSSGGEIQSRLLGALRRPPPLLEKLAAVPGLYLVGGWLRDIALGRGSSDFDLIALDGFDQLSIAVIAALGQQPYLVNERFATTRFLLPDGSSLDLQPCRPGGIAADLAQRDYSVNTLCYPLAALGPQAALEHLSSHPLALADLEQRVLRMVDPVAMAADPLRVLRGYRLCTGLGLRPDVETRRCWHELRGRIFDSAAERIREELLQWFAAPEPDPAFPRWPSFPLSVRWAAEDGVLWQLFPPLEAAIGCEQNVYHHLDVWNHTLECLVQLEALRARLKDDQPAELSSYAPRLRADWDAPFTAAAPASALTRLSLLLHDIAKPPTRAVQADGKVTFYGHQEVGAELVRPLLERLRFSLDEQNFVRSMVAEHLRLGFYAEHDPIPPRLLYRFIRSLGAATPLAVLHSLADCAATQGEGAEESLHKHLRAAQQVLQSWYSADEVARPPLLLDGHAIMQLTGLPPGKRVGEIKEALLEATAAGDVANEDAAREFVLRLMKE